MKRLQGIGASEGISYAKVYTLVDNMPAIVDTNIEDIEAEKAKLDSAVQTAQTQILALKDRAMETLGLEKAMVFDAHFGIASDPAMMDMAKATIESEKVNATFALDAAATVFKNMFLAMDDHYMQERAADVADVTSRIIKIMEGVEILDLSAIDEEVIIVSHDLTPSETSQLNPEFVKGFITEIGGRTSHSAIMARSLEIPAVVGVGKELFNMVHGEMVLMDGSKGEVVYRPATALVEEFMNRAEALEIFKKEAAKFVDMPSKSKDGWKTKVAANIGSPSDMDGYEAAGADGSGLFRSEFLYMEADNWPTEEEQFESYKEVLERANGDKIVIRTLDIGGDKILKYFTFPEEMNPFLGYRAIRFQLDRKDILVTQARALLRASAFGTLAINIPMIATIDEFTATKKIFDKVEAELKEEGIAVGKYELGIMVEAPAAVMLADKFAKHADFFSIGSNDLIQYTFAADRMSEKVSYLYQPFNPSLLRMVKMTIDASHDHGKWTAICGEIAGEPLLTPVFVGMGLDEFSMSATSILKIRKLISEIDKSEAEVLVAEVLEMENETQVKSHIENWLKERSIVIF